MTLLRTHFDRALLVLLASTFLVPLSAATIDADGRRLTVTSSNLTAVFDGGSLASLKNRISSEIYNQQRVASEQADVNLLQPGRQSLTPGNWRLSGDGTATLALKGAERTVSIRVRVDEAADEIVVEVSGESQYTGVRGVRWPIPGVNGDVRLIVPARSGSVFDGRSIRTPVTLSYPSEWEAQMLVLEGAEGSLLIYSPDRNASFKTFYLNRGLRGTANIALETEAAAPWQTARHVPRVEWRLKAFAGDWRRAAAAYKQAMAAVLPASATGPRSREPGWTQDIGAVVTLVSLDVAILDRLAGLLVPSKTLIYLVDWRRDAYDVNYPDYTPREGAEALLRRAHALGFRVMLHANLYGVSPRNPDYAAVRRFQIKSPDTLEPQGWFWDQPDSTAQRFAYINPASAAFRDLLVRRLKPAVLALQPDAIHLDVSGVMFNDGNGPVDGMNAVQGALALHADLRSAFPNIALGAEGMNELLAAPARFAQRWLTEYDAHPISTYLFGSNIRQYGYLGQPGPEDPRFVSYLEKYEKQGVLPTLRTVSPSDFDAVRTGMRRLVRLLRLWQDREFELDWTAEANEHRLQYTSSADGTATLIDSGGIVRLQVGAETVYERAHGTNRIRTDSFIPGWPAFDHVMLYGLNPRRQYWLEQRARPAPPARVAFLPLGVELGSDTTIARPYARFDFEAAKTTIYDFLNGFPKARKGVTRAGRDFALSRGAAVNLTTMSCGGERREAIFAHPPYQPPEGRTFVEYTLDIPESPDVMLEFEMGVSDSAPKNGAVTFAVAAGQTELFRQQVMRGKWHRRQVSLSRYRGATIPIRFLTTIEGQKDDGWDWAGWSRLRLVSRGALRSLDVPIELAAGPPASALSGGDMVAHTSTSLTFKNVPIPGRLLLFLQPGTPVSSGLDLLDLPPTIWHGAEGDLPQIGPIWSSGQIAPVASGRVTRARAISGHPPDQGRTILAWTLRLPQSLALQLNWSAGIADGSRSAGIQFEVRINGESVWSHAAHGVGWTSGGVDLTAWMGNDVLVELVSDSLGDNVYDWAQWSDLTLRPTGSRR